MPTYPIQIKRSGTAASAPSSLAHGELALNYADKVLYFKDASNVIQSFTFQSYALASHTHAASDITSGTLDIARIADDAVTYAKIQNVSATDRLLGRSSAGAGDVEEITCTSFARTLIDDADAATARTTLGVQPTASPAFTGAATFANTGNVVPLAVTNTGTANSFVVNDASGDTTPFVIDADGNAGIGYSTPSDYGKLVVSGGTDANAPVVTIESTAFNASQGCSLDFARAGFTQKVQARLATQDNGASASNFIIYTKADGTAGALSARLTISSAGTATFAGQVVVTAGSVSACSVAASGDPNSGLYFPSADVAAWVTNGTERVRVGSGGRVQFFAADEKYGIQINKGATGNGPFIGSDGADIFTISTAGGAERLRLGSDGSLTASEVYNDTVGATNRDLFVDSTGKFGYVSSIRESKTDIVTLDDVSWLTALSPVSYRYRKRNADGTYSDEADGVTDYGLIAEDVEAVRPELCFYDDVDGEPQLRGVTYRKLITPMLRYIQQLEARIAALEERLNHA